jgi:membrane-associated phospholipid phosphatase
MEVTAIALHTPWHAITRLGEAGIALPVALALGVWLLVSARSVRLASCWFVPLGLAVLLTTLSKVAFLGWGLGIASIDFTGLSGHSMFAAAVYPMLAYAMTHPLRERGHHRVHAFGLIACYALAAVIAVSRVELGAHSVSEALAGFALGSAASGCALWMTEHTRHRVPGAWLCVGVAAWLATSPAYASPSKTHSMVTRLALTLSQRSKPYERADLHRAARAAAPAITRRPSTLPFIAIGADKP